MVLLVSFFGAWAVCSVVFQKLGLSWIARTREYAAEHAWSLWIAGYSETRWKIGFWLNLRWPVRNAWQELLSTPYLVHGFLVQNDSLDLR
jgi:hypothetical protein